jgi:CTP:molybdopterin cytidylyltransferase MocA
MTAGPVVGAVLAAGAGRRFADGVKQLAPFSGRPLVEWSIAAMAAADRVERTVVVVGFEAEAIRAAADLSPATPVLAPDWEEGRSAALRAAVRAAGKDASALVVVLGDQPLLHPGAIDKAVERAGRRPARAFYDGRPGHPFVLPRHLFAAAEALTGDRGLRQIESTLDVIRVDCDGLGSSSDIDTTIDLARLRSTSA